jgi:hypothetical protein
VSLPSSASQPPATKPGTNIYTVMLILSFCFIVTATVILSLELARFGPIPQWKVTSAGGS